MIPNILRRLQGGNLEVFKVSSALIYMSSKPLQFLSFQCFYNGLSPACTNLFSLQFGMYVLFPIGWMYYFGTNLDDRFNVKGFWPTAEQSHKIPLDKEEIDKELSRMRMADALRRERQQKEQEALAAQAQAQADTQQSQASQ
ncbi:uncharacterized protein N7482_005188 [Penicillium canariense]|uniref:Mitochondrial cytochrome c oxidase assembly factor n=1 Tax=Penicillium canariense TaxID=189055 RepID=A0A9W9LMC4_9EURO|nr:uncharacterized protein N7482_005188 [Penicillium canariense]KAJ5166407.1 hypothetical protein N7482_005188 [Penicillium canariense]